MYFSVFNGVAVLMLNISVVKSSQVPLRSHNLVQSYDQPRIITTEKNINRVIRIDSRYSYNLSPPFSSNLELGWLADTYTGSQAETELLRDGARSGFIIYDDEFSNIIGPDPRYELVIQSNESLAFEGGAWDSERNEVWFSSAVTRYNVTWLSILQLSNNNKIIRPSFTGDPIVTPNGGVFYDGKIYFTTVGNFTHPGGVIAIDPATYEAKTLINSYYGLRFNFPDDVVWVRRGGKSYMFFTDLGIPGSDLPAVQLKDPGN